MMGYQNLGGYESKYKDIKCFENSILSNILQSTAIYMKKTLHQE